MTLQDLVVSVDRVLPAPPETVYEAITDPTLFAQWMGPDGSTVTVQEMNLTLGGEIRFTVELPDGGPEFTLRGFYEVIEPPRRLVHSWAMVGDDEVSTIVFDLEPHGEGTRLQLNHHGLTRPEDVGQNQAGWSHQLDRLERLFS